MTDGEELENRHDALIEEYQLFLRGQGPEPDLSDLPPHRQETIREQFKIVKALADRSPELPSIERDPVALRLGLVGPGASSFAPLLPGTRHTTIDDLADTVRDGLAEDERLARELAAWADGTGRADGGAFEFHRLIGDPLLGPFGGQSPIRNWGTGQDIAKLADPVRVLADVARTRALVDKLLAEKHVAVEPSGCECPGATPVTGPCDCGRDDRVRDYLTLLAQPYAEVSDV